MSGGAAHHDVAVIGGGIVGCAIALGLRNLGRDVCVLDEGDRAFRASRGNFGMVWVQGKGSGFTPYAHLTRMAADGWAGFEAQLREAAGFGADFYQPGGFGFCLGAAELEAKSQAMAALHRETNGRFVYETLDAAQLRKELPWLGADVAGAIFCPTDGGVNPLNLLAAMQTALGRADTAFFHGTPVDAIAPAPGGGFAIMAGDTRVTADKVVLAAGLGNARLAEGLGLFAPVRPVRGQVVVTERVPPLMRNVSNVFRQMPEGSCLIGDTMEEVGFDEGVTPQGLHAIAARAVRVCPPLARVNVVRSWGALRVMTPDGLPIYQQSERHPGAWLATVHSGITLAPVHATALAAAIAGDALAEPLQAFSARRFAAGATPDQMVSH